LYDAHYPTQRLVKLRDEVIADNFSLPIRPGLTGDKEETAAADRAVGRTPDGSEWKLEDALDPYTGTILPAPTGCPPTPALPNSCGVVPTRVVTWSRVKSLYR